MLREGQLKVLKPAIDRGDIKVVGQQWVPEWSASTALRITEDALTANNNKIDAIVASNDGTAGGAIQRSPRSIWPARCRCPGRTRISRRSSA